MSPAPRWGLSPLDWHAHAINELVHHPIGVYVARCGHRLMMLITLHESPPSRICLSSHPVGRPMSRQHPGESYRHAIDARRPNKYGGGTCTVLVRRIDGRVELLFHACPETGAIMTPEQAVEIAEALNEAAEGR